MPWAAAVVMTPDVTTAAACVSARTLVDVDDGSVVSADVFEPESVENPIDGMIDGGVDDAGVAGVARVRKPILTTVGYVVAAEEPVKSVKVAGSHLESTPE